MMKIILLLALLLSGYNTVQAKTTIDDNKVVLSMIGEAEDQGYEGLLAVACAIRNRGTLKVVYGLHAPRVKHHKYSDKTLFMARQAWKDSLHHDITNGSNSWENVTAFGKPWWAQSCNETVKIKDHQFYKC